MTSIIDAIVDENLAVYRASPSRVREDASQEAQIANDYRGRLLYELLQNADDAMVDGGGDDRIVFRLTEDDLWVGNSGRPLNDADVRGLCGIGASSKSVDGARRRASIGHKGMGFKSVLEITERPTVYSESISFELSSDSSEPGIRAALGAEESMPTRLPIMRLPSRVSSDNPEWHRLAASGIRTLFRFPLKPDLDSERRDLLAQRLLELPATAILFLKHLENLDIEVATAGNTETTSWRLRRERLDHGGESTPGLVETGVYRVAIESSRLAMSFVLAHDADVEIGQHRGGLDEHGWGAIELTEVSVACAVDGTRPTELAQELRKFHVFLPTGEVSPYPLLVNGAFMTDLSRQELRIGEESDDYNQFLMQRVAALVRERLLPALETDGASWEDIVTLFDRPGAPDVAPQTQAGEALWRAMSAEVGSYPLLPAHDGRRLYPGEAIVPPLLERDETGSSLRELLPDSLRVAGREFPAPAACRSTIARTAADLGALVLEPIAVPSHLATDDLKTVRLEYRADAAIAVDPVLEVLQAIWEELGLEERELFADQVRKNPLFPVSTVDGTVDRVVTKNLECFYPPRSLKGAVPLKNLCFLLQDICWGTLPPMERQARLHDELVAWQGLFQIREFKFPDVMRASVLPSLALDTVPDPDLQRLEALAAICQLSGRTPNPKQPLRYERLGSNRALFNLCRLPLPCRFPDGTDAGWEPAYKVYFGDDWIGRDSIEWVLNAMRDVGQEVPHDLLFLQSPKQLDGLLSKFDHLQEIAEEDAADSDEVELEEDEEEAYDAGKEQEQWLVFLEWLGVNRAVRLVHFHDAEDQKGWLSTKRLLRPEGWAFSNIPAALWESFVERALSVLPDVGVPYFFQLHDLDRGAAWLDAAAADESCSVARALYAHFERNWNVLSRFTNGQVAVVAPGVVPTRRQKPPRPREDELRDAGTNFWLARLRTAQWCPTTHGPRRPGETWLRTPEVNRRFGRQGSDPRQLLPLLDNDGKSSDRVLAIELGVRAELTPTSFGPEDARSLLGRLKLLFDDKTANGPLDERQLRTVVRPAYRNLIELLPGRDDALEGEWERNALRDEPLLTHDGNGGFRFKPSTTVYHIERPGTRERLGSPPDLWSFVLEGARGARGPLTALFGVQVLEESIEWTSNPGDPALEGEDEVRFREGLRNLEPFLAARVAADRQEESLVLQDRRRLSAFVNQVDPVSSLELRCTVGDVDLGSVDSRDAFVDGSGASLTAFVVWGERPWPPTPENSEALATALADLLQPGYFEAFLALITASSDDARSKLLRLAGAPKPQELPTLESESEVEAEAPESELLKTTGEQSGEAPPSSPQPGSSPIIVMRPLFRPEELLIETDPVLVAGTIRIAKPKAPPDGHGKGNRSDGVYGGRTDLSELDHVGMAVAISFECRRLRSAGWTEAGVYDPDTEPNAHAYVFDVSTKEAIDAARQGSARFGAALDWLAAKGLKPLSPGFDVLTLDPAGDPVPQRLIELKSSGVNARLQEMSWNEWKSARDSTLRERYFLYLVGNLRSDLGDARPFLRAVRDPFGSILAEERVEQVETRRIRIDTSGFTTAEEVFLTVKRLAVDPTAEPPSEDG